MNLFLSIVIFHIACLFAGISEPGHHKAQDNEITRYLKGGSYHALIIGVNDYKDKAITDLNYPLENCRKLKDLLIDEYLFDKQNVVLLKNPSRSELVGWIDDYSVLLGENDNLLICYSGNYGCSDSMGSCYWLPSDARLDDKSTFFYNSMLVELIAHIPVRHVLLITDTHMSASVFRGLSLGARIDGTEPPGEVMKRFYPLNSRFVIFASDPDHRVDGRFLETFYTLLQENEGDIYLQQSLAHDMRTSLANTGELVGFRPAAQPIRRTGDEGGQFVFIRRE